MNLIDDVYYTKEYVSLYAEENAEVFEFEYKDGDKIFYTTSIKRPINRIGNEIIEDGYCDLETAYGYGGFYCNVDDQLFVKKALSLYKKKCLDEKIIAEFIRFHAFNEFPKNHNNLFDLNLHDRNIVIVDLEQSKEQRWLGYPKKTRNTLRKCKKELIFSKTSNVDGFIDLYEKTMQRNNASDFYFFDNKYYQALLQNKDMELYEIRKDDVVIASAFFMFSDDFSHYHLSANNYEFRQHNANYYILDEIFDVAKDRGKKYFILGGGTTSAEDDSLYKFKKKFSSLVKPFYISGKIYNKDIYFKYVKKWEEQSELNIRYFLKYRRDIR